MSKNESKTDPWVPWSPTDHLPQVLEMARNASGKSQAAVAREMGSAHGGTARKLELESANPTWGQLWKYGKAVDLKPAELIWHLYKLAGIPWPREILNEQMRAAGIDPDRPDVGRSDLEEATDHLESASTLIRKAGGSVRSALALSQDDPETSEDED